MFSCLLKFRKILLLSLISLPSPIQFSIPEIVFLSSTQSIIWIPSTGKILKKYCLYILFLYLLLLFWSVKYIKNTASEEERKFLHMYKYWSCHIFSLVENDILLHCNTLFIFTLHRTLFRCLRFKQYGYLELLKMSKKWYAISGNVKNMTSSSLLVGFFFLTIKFGHKYFSLKEVANSH